MPGHRRPRRLRIQNRKLATALRTLKYLVKNELELGAEGLITQKGGGRKSIHENKKIHVRSSDLLQPVLILAAVLALKY
jgi:hypothetical protein